MYLRASAIVEIVVARRCGWGYLRFAWVRSEFDLDGWSQAWKIEEKEEMGRGSGFCKERGGVVGSGNRHNYLT